MSHDDFEVEPIPGLPARPPKGETILWQGQPHWRAVARRVLHLPMVTAYVVLVLGWRIASLVAAGHPPGQIAAAMLPLTVMSLLGLGGLALYAWAIARTTIYTVTTQRVAMRFGVALPVTFNLPFTQIVSAGVTADRAGRGDIALRLTPSTRIAYLVLWPHARAWRLRSPEPTLRALPDVASVGELLGKALRETLPQEATPSEAVAAAPPAADRPVRESQPYLVAAE
jgi:hypothetical protein